MHKLFNLNFMLFVQNLMQEKLANEEVQLTEKKK